MREKFDGVHNKNKEVRRQDSEFMHLNHEEHEEKLKYRIKNPGARIKNTITTDPNDQNLKPRSTRR